MGDLGWRPLSEERQKVESANVLAQLRKVRTDSMVAHKRQMDLEVETMKREMRVVVMHALKKNVDGDMVEPNGVDVIQACLNRIELGTALETQANEDVEDKRFVVMQHIGMNDEIRYHQCMANVNSITK